MTVSDLLDVPYEDVSSDIGFANFSSYSFYGNMLSTSGLGYYSRSNLTMEDPNIGFPA